MPIRPSQRPLYPTDWSDISRTIKQRAGWRCEGSPAYPDCRAEHGAPHPVTGSKVVLTTAHLDHNPANCAANNLRAWCQRCHLTYDAPHHAETRRVNKLRKIHAKQTSIPVAGTSLVVILAPNTFPIGSTNTTLGGLRQPRKHS